MTSPFCYHKLENSEALFNLVARCSANPWPHENLSSLLKMECGFHWGVRDPDLIAFFLGNLVLGELDVIHLGVDPQYRRKGIGESLLRFVLDFPAVRKVFLEVDPGNKEALALYQKLGFRELSIRKNYYEGKRDALVLWKARHVMI